MPLPPKINPSVTMLIVEEKPNVTYDDVGGCKEQIEKLREVCTFFHCFISKNNEGLISMKSFEMKCKYISYYHWF